jgi:hypothetical protein
MLIDTTSGTSQLITPKTVPRSVAFEWAPDGRRLFFNTDSYQANQTAVGEYELDTHQLHQAILPFGGAISGVAIDQPQARALLNATLGAATACLSPTVQPSGRTASCGFRF